MVANGRQFLCVRLIDLHIVWYISGNFVVCMNRFSEFVCPFFNQILKYLLPNTMESFNSFFPPWLEKKIFKILTRGKKE